jgi:hypothetical protein
MISRVNFLVLLFLNMKIYLMVVLLDIRIFVTSIFPSLVLFEELCSTSCGYTIELDKNSYSQCRGM